MLILIESCLCDGERIYILRSKNGQVVYSTKSPMAIADKLKDLFEPKDQDNKD